jgi:antitoxin component of MazEF toxin-antitoxin module
MADKRTRMEIMVSKWGNSLAVRLPAKLTKRLDVA